MISRVADHCFWVGRYIERAESTARLLQVTRALAFDAELPPLHCWRPLMIVSGQHPEFTKHFGADAAGNGDIVQRYMTWEPENPVSIRTSIRAAREGARSIREVLGHEIWQATNELYLWFAGEEAAASYLHDRDEVYRNVRRSTQLCLGLVRSTMLHDEPMDFLWLGVLLERIGQTARILDMHHYLLDEDSADGSGKHQIVQTALWLSLLRTCSGFEAFMRVHKGRVTGSEAVEFLLFEERFPRSLRYCVRSALGLMRRIWPAPAAVTAQAPLRRMAALDAWLERQQDGLVAASIHDLLTHVVDEVALTCSEVRHGMSGTTAPGPEPEPEPEPKAEPEPPAPVQQ